MKKNCFINRLFKLITKNKLFVFVFLSFFCLFPSGAINSNTFLQNISTNISNIVKNNTIQKKYCSLIVEPKDKNDRIDTDTFSEFSNVYGVFGEARTNFISAVNTDKKNKVIIQECNDNINLSFLYVEISGFYNSYDSEAGVWRHQFYPMSLMFQGDHAYNDSFSFCYISKTQANKILKKSIDYEGTKEEYFSLIQSSITIEMNGKPLIWKIANIYYETGTFYEDVHGIMGDFLLSYKIYPADFPKQSVYFMRQEVFQNNYLIKRCLKIYPKNTFEYRIGDYNLINKNININISFPDTFIPNFISVFLLFGFVSLLAFSTYEIIKKRILFTVFRLVLALTVSIIPFLFFKLLNWAFKFPFLFSSTSIFVYIICLIIFIISTSLSFAVQKRRDK